MCQSLIEVYVTICNREIVSYVESIGGKAIMTATTHERASDRTAEAMLKIEKEAGHKMDVVPMIQGDEPMVYPEMIDTAIKPMLEDSTIQGCKFNGAFKFLRGTRRCK